MSAYAASVNAMFDGPPPAKARHAAGRFPSVISGPLRQPQLSTTNKTCFTMAFSATAPSLVKRNGMGPAAQTARAPVQIRADVRAVQTAQNVVEPRVLQGATTGDSLGPTATVEGELKSACKDWSMRARMSSRASKLQRGRDRCGLLAEKLDQHVRQREVEAAAECGQELAMLLAQGAMGRAEEERLASLLRLLARLHLEFGETDEALGAAKAALCLHPDPRAHWTNAQALQRAQQLEPAARAQLVAYALGSPPDEAAWKELLHELRRTRHYYHSQIAAKRRPKCGARRASWHGRGVLGEDAPTLGGCAVVSDRRRRPRPGRGSRRG